MDLVHEVGTKSGRGVMLVGCSQLLEHHRVSEAIPILLFGQGFVCPQGGGRDLWLSQVRPSHLRDEKVAEERSKKKVSKKLEEADARKQKTPRRVRADCSCMCRGEGVAGNLCTVLPRRIGIGYSSLWVC